MDDSPAQTPTTSSPADEIAEFKLGRDEELRFEVPEGKDSVHVTLTAGIAEVFGTEMIVDKTYKFGPQAKSAVFTYHGCTVVIKGKTEIAYIAKETPMIMYLNTHAALETMRRNAEADSKKGPITLVVGPTDVGKSTICRILLNYAVRVGRRPLFVDLDVGQGTISVPGMIGSIMVERLASIEENGFTDSAAPITYFYGYTTPGANIPLYNVIISKLSEVSQERLESNRRVKSSGIIINTSGWVKGDGYRSITHIAQAFEVDVVLVLDQERLYNELARDLPSFVKVVYLPKSGGVVERTQTYRAEARDTRIRQYFYGNPTHQTYYPHSFRLKFSDAQIYKIGTPAVSSSLLPLGMKLEDSRTKLVPVALNPKASKLLHQLLGVSFAKDPNDEDVIRKNIAGVVCITDIDMDKEELTILSPMEGPLPKAVLLLSEIQFMDSR